MRHLIGRPLAGVAIRKRKRRTSMSRRAERRQDSPQAHRQGRARRRLLVDQRLQRRGLFRDKPPQRLLAQQPHRKKDADGSVTVQFGGCDGKTPNCLPIMPGWNYIVRLYRPRKEILNGLEVPRTRSR